MNGILLRIAFVSLCAAGISPQGPPGEDLHRALERFGRDALEGGARGLALAIDSGGELVFAGGWGVTDEGDARAGPDSPMLGSFLAVAALRLAEREELALNTPLVKLMPELYAEHPEITVDRLLTHTSGIPPYGELLAAQHLQAAPRNARSTSASTTPAARATASQQRVSISCSSCRAASARSSCTWTTEASSRAGIPICAWCSSSTTNVRSR